MDSRRLCLLLAVLAAGAAPLTAQARAGVHVGLNRSSLIMDSGDSAWRNGLIAGVWVRFPLAGAVAVRLGAYTAEKGGAEKEGALAKTAAIECLCSEVKLNYFEFPLTVNFLINRSEPISEYIAVGGAFGLQRSCSVISEEASNGAECEVEAPHVNTESWEGSLVLGGGLELDRGPIILTLDGRLTWGITDILDVVGSSSDPDASNSGQSVSIALMAGVAFPLG